MRDCLAQVRWHAELGANGFDWLAPDDAAENARLSLISIVELLDDLDDTDRLVSILGVVGVEPRFRRKGVVR